MPKPEELMTPFERFKIEEERIREEARESEARCNKIIREKEKVRDAVAAGRAKAQAILDGMIKTYERVDAELEGEAAKRMDLAGLTKESVADGRITADAYFRGGLTDAEATAKAQAEASAKLADLRDVARGQAVKVLELEFEEADAEYQIDHARTYPAIAFRERLASLLKAVETYGGMGGGLSSLDKRNRAEADLRIATKGRIPGMDGRGWITYDLTSLKRLRLDPLWPIDQLPRLEEIIAEAATTGRSVRLMIDSRDQKKPIGVMWE